MTATAGMRWVPGGSFLMGSDDFYPEERPVHRVNVDGFWMDEHLVAEFGASVEATGHRTLAEQAPVTADYPDADPTLVVPGSLVFQTTDGPVDLNNVGDRVVFPSVDHLISPDERLRIAMARQ